MLPLRAAAILLLMLPQPVRADGETKLRMAKAMDRAYQETAALIPTVLRDHVPRQHPCIFGADWYSRSVDVVLAQQYLGSGLYADVSAPHTDIGPAKLIDPAGTMQDHFCTDAEATEMWKQRQADFSNGALPADIDQRYRQPAISMMRIKISMPVFDAAYTTSVVLVSSLRHAAVKEQPGKVKQLGSTGESSSLVYRKLDGVWTLIHSTEDYSFH